MKVPPLDPLTEEQANAENIDTEGERAFGELKRQERKRILEDDDTAGPPVKKHASSEFIFHLPMILLDCKPQYPNVIAVKVYRVSAVASYAMDPC